MPNASYKILSPHYEGGIFKDAAPLKPLDLKSGQPYKIPIGTFSSAFGEHPHYPIDKTAGKAYLRTSGNLFEFDMDDVAQYGTFFNHDDTGINGWLDAAEKVKPVDFDIIDSPNFVGNLEGIPLRMHFPYKGDTPVNLYTAHTTAQVPLNETGHWMSRHENFRQQVLDFLWDYREAHRGEINPELQAWVEFLAERGFENPHQLIATGIGFIPENAVAAMLFPKDQPGYAYITANPHFNEMVARLVERFGAEGENAFRLFKDYILLHELGFHSFPQGQKSILGEGHIERKAGNYQAKFYNKRKKIVGADDARVYEALEMAAKRYTRLWTPWKALIGSLTRFYSIEDEDTRNYINDLEAIVKEEKPESTEIEEEEHTSSEQDESNAAEFSEEAKSECPEISSGE